MLVLLLVLPKRCMPQPCRWRAASAAEDGVAGTAEKVSLPRSLRSLSKMRLMNSWPCRDTSSSRPDSSKEKQASKHRMSLVCWVEGCEVTSSVDDEQLALQG